MSYKTHAISLKQSPLFHTTAIDVLKICITSQSSIWDMLGPLERGQHSFHVIKVNIIIFSWEDI